MSKLKPIVGWKPVLITLLEGGASMQMASANIGVPITRVWNEQTLDPVFKAQCDKAARRGRGEENRSGAVGETARVGADVKGGRVIVGGHF